MGSFRQARETRAVRGTWRQARACGAFRLLLSTLLPCHCLCTGCMPSINTYSTPRTVPGPKLEHTVAAEGFVDLKHRRRGVQQALPLPTVYALRFAYLERADLGVRVAHPGSVVLDTKWNFLRSRVFDAAIDPGFASELDLYVARLWWHLPLMVGVNVEDWLSMVFVQGVSRMYALRNVDPVDVELFRDDDWYYRAGLGLDMRIASGLALHPEATIMHPIASRNEITLPLQVGMAANWGGLPSFP
jgi:hypothetical protein